MATVYRIRLLCSDLSLLVMVAQSLWIDQTNTHVLATVQ
uniref:Uncharacterized protein n=1 Tax=Anguilla anguilla TaxID=7936 RepID=A0A0E9RCU1_ANGAN